MIILFIDFISESKPTSFTLLPEIGLPDTRELAIFLEILLISARYFCSFFPYLSFERLTNDLIVVSNSCLIFPASSFSSSNCEPNNNVSKYSNALPLPVIPTFVSVDAGSKLRNASNAFAFVAAR